MTSKEIREKDAEFGIVMKETGSADKSVFIIQAAQLAMIVEIAAQLAELNENIKLLRPIDKEIGSQATEPYGAEEESLKEKHRKFQELLSTPTSDHENLVRCCDCGREIPRLPYIPVGGSYICDDCIPF